MTYFPSIDISRLFIQFEDIAFNTKPQHIKRHGLLQHYQLLFVVFLVILGATCSMGELSKKERMLQPRSTRQVNIAAEELQKFVFENVGFFVNKVGPLELMVILKWPSKAIKTKKLSLLLFILREGPRPDTSYNIKETHYTSDVIAMSSSMNISLVNSPSIPVTYNSAYKIRLVSMSNQPSKFYPLWTPLCSSPNVDQTKCLSNDSRVESPKVPERNKQAFEIPVVKLLCFNYKKNDETVMIKIDWLPVEETNYNNTFPNGSLATREDIRRNAKYLLKIGGDYPMEVNRPHTARISLNSKYDIRVLARIFSADIIYHHLMVSTFEDGLDAMFQNEQICQIEKTEPAKLMVSELKMKSSDAPDLRLLCFNYEKNDETVMIKIDWLPIEETIYNHTFPNGSLATREDIRRNATYQMMTHHGPLIKVGRPHTTYVSINSSYMIILLGDVFSEKVVYSILRVNTFKDGLAAMFQNEQICPKKRELVVLVGLLMSALVIGGAVLLMIMTRRQLKSRYNDNLFTKTNSYKSNPSESMNVLRESVSTNGSNTTATTIVDEWEVDPDELILDQEIGQGAFGRVVCGWYKKKMVAIKVLKETIPNLYRDELLREIALLKGMGSHPNIVSILGASTIKNPIALVMEYVPFGDMHSFLKRCKNNFDWKEDSKELVSTHCLQDRLTGAKEVWQVTSKDLISWSRQIALAMEYLASKQYVHRDLAARNILMASNKSVMLCDFGLARLIYNGDNHYFRRTNCKLPLKWMAIESIKDRLYTSKSDVWSFGILLWEIATFGATPYENIPIVDLYKYLAGGYRMNQPWNCSNELYHLMMNCWEKNPDDRPSFSQLRSSLEMMLSRGVDYLDLDIGNSSPNASPLLNNNLALKDNKLPSYDYDSNEKKNLYNNTQKNGMKLDENQHYKKVDINKDILNSGPNEMMYTKNSSYNDELCVVLNNSTAVPQLVKSSEFNLGKLPESYNSKVVKNTSYGDESEMRGIDKSILWPQNNQPLALPFTELLLKLNGFNGKEAMNNK